jgi:hypothetical protein
MTQARLELEALWTAAFGGPPPVAASPALLSRIIVECLPLAPPYGSLGAPPSAPLPGEDLVQQELVVGHRLGDGEAVARELDLRDA